MGSFLTFPVTGRILASGGGGGDDKLWARGSTVEETWFLYTSYKVEEVPEEA